MKTENSFFSDYETAIDTHFDQVYAFIKAVVNRLTNKRLYYRQIHVLV